MGYFSLNLRPIRGAETGETDVCVFVQVWLCETELVKVKSEGDTQCACVHYDICTCVLDSIWVDWISGSE